MNPLHPIARSVQQSLKNFRRKNSPKKTTPKNTLHTLYMENEIPQKEPKDGRKIIFALVVVLHLVVIGSIIAYCKFARSSAKDVASTAKPESSQTSEEQSAVSSEDPNKPSIATNPDSSKPGSESLDGEPVNAGAKPATAPAPEAVTPNTVVDTGKPQAPLLNEASSPAPAAAPAMPVAPMASAMVSTPATLTTYTVKSGDTLRKVARRNGMTMTELKKLNGLKVTALKIGQVLKIKSANGTSKMVAHSAAPASTGTHPASLAATSASTYKVGSGDTLTKIARKFNTSPAAIMAANKIVDANKLKIGASLVIPQRSGKSSVSDNAAPVVIPTQTASVAPDLVMNKVVDVPEPPISCVSVPSSSTGRSVTSCW